MTNEDITAKRAELNEYFAYVKARRAEIASLTKAYTSGLKALKEEGISITQQYNLRLNEYYHLGETLRKRK